MESNTDSRKRALYVNNVTTKDYMRSYLPKHKDSNIFSYITFTYNINGTVHPWNRHGDIFYNGNKLTYINDVCHTDLVADDHSYYLAYFNSDGALDFAQSYIYVESGNNIIKDSYSLYSNHNPEITLNHWTNFRDFVNFNIKENDGWQYDNINDNEIAFSKSGDKLTITTRDITTSKHFTISYQFHVDGNSYNDYYDVNFNIYDTITSVDFFDFPDRLDVGQIYTPKIKILPTNQLSYYTFKYSISDSNCVELNENTGRFICVNPIENITLTCSYYKPGETEQSNSFSKTFKINKIRNHLTVTSTYTTHIDNSGDPMFAYTVCYVHGYPNIGRGSMDITFTAVENNGDLGRQTHINSSGENFAKLMYSNDHGKGVYKVGARIDSSKYCSYSSYMEIYSNLKLPPIDSLNFTLLDHEDYCIRGVITAKAGIGDDTNCRLTSTNFKFNSSGKYDNFVITDIVHSGDYTYTYIYADEVSDSTYALIQISSMDDSFITYTFEIENN